MSENKPVIKVDDLGLQFGDISGLKNLLRELQKHVEDMDGWALIFCMDGCECPGDLLNKRIEEALSPKPGSETD